MEREERELARVEECEIGIEDHGILTLFISWEYDGSSCHQGLGCYAIDAAFLYRIFDCFGVSRLGQIKGKSCWVTHDWGHVSKIEPLHKKDGKPFVIQEWQDWINAHPEMQKSPHELRTGKARG